MDKRSLIMIILILITLPYFSGCLEENGNGNNHKYIQVITKHGEPLLIKGFRMTPGVLISTPIIFCVLLYRYCFH